MELCETKELWTGTSDVVDWKKVEVHYNRLTLRGWRDDTVSRENPSKNRAVY